MAETRKCGAADTHPMGEEFPGLRDCPSIARQVGMALFVLAMGPERVGFATRHKLMWPYTDYTDNDVRRAAATLLANVQKEQTTGLTYVDVVFNLKLNCVHEWHRASNSTFDPGGNWQALRATD